MLRYFFYFFKKNIKPGSSCLFFNSSFLSYKRRIKIILKSGVKVGKGTTIVAPVYFENGNIQLHENVLVNSGCTFLDNEKIIIMRDSMIGPNVILATVSHHVDPRARHKDNITAPITIGENVWIGAGCVICPGVSIGNNSIIGANSVVTSSIPENTLSAGAPAKIKKTLTSI